MKSLAKIFTLSALLAALAVPAHATVNLTLEAENLLVGGNGSANVNANSLVLLVADTGNNGFSSLAYGNVSIGAKIGPAFDDLIVAQFAISAGSFLTNNENVLSANPSLALFGDWVGGQQLAIYWIPSLNFGDSNVGLGVAYGMYTDATGVNGSAPWITPADGNTANPMFFSTTGVFSSSHAADSAGYASFATVVPEPSTFALLSGLATLGFAGWRRRKSA